MKTPYIKIYDLAGNFKGMFNNFGFSSFTASINGGLGEMTLEIPKTFDDFGEGEMISFNYEIQLWVHDRDSGFGTLIYSGYISDYDGFAQDTETVTVRATGYVSKLELDILRSGNTIKLAYASQEPGALMKTIINLYRTNNPGAKVNFSISSITSTGKSISVDFDTVTYLDALTEIKSLADVNWFWYIGADNILSFSPIPSTPTHYFTVGKDIENIRFSKSILEMRNGLIFWNGLQPQDAGYISKFYSDTASISTYGRQVSAIRDGRYKVLASANEYATRYVNTYKDPINTLTFNVLDNNLGKGFDIDSIRPGQACKILNIDPNNAFSSNMIITSITYSFDRIEVTVADVRAYLNRSIFDLRKKIDERTYSNSAPTSYT